jgi:hypothetical protein
VRRRRRHQVREDQAFFTGDENLDTGMNLKFKTLAPVN